MNKEIKKIYHKIIASGLSVVVSTGINLHNPEKANAKNLSIQMIPITTLGACRFNP